MCLNRSTPVSSWKRLSPCFRRPEPSIPNLSRKSIWLFRTIDMLPRVLVLVAPSEPQTGRHFLRNDRHSRLTTIIKQA
jgi:hypothetical protein